MEKEYAIIKKKYSQKSIRARIEALFLDNLGKIVTREQILEVSKDPITNKIPENWHQRLSELRTDYGYTILSWRDRSDLKISEYLMLTAEKRKNAGKRLKIEKKTWLEVLVHASYMCEWVEDSFRCNLKEGDIDPIGGGKVKLTPDHKKPHSINPESDPNDSTAWQALCGRHQVMKKNYWDNTTGKINILAIVQSASENDKKVVYEFLKDYFND